MRVFGRSRVPSTQGTEAARLLIAGDLDGALIAAEHAKTARDSLIRSEGYAVLAWVHIMRGERDEAEAAASVARRMRTRDPLLPVALVVAGGGPSAGAAVALIETHGVTSMIAATRVFADHGRLADVRAEIARLSPKEGAGRAAESPGRPGRARTCTRHRRGHRPARAVAVDAGSRGRLRERPRRVGDDGTRPALPPAGADVRGRVPARGVSPQPGES